MSRSSRLRARPGARLGAALLGLLLASLVPAQAQRQVLLRGPEPVRDLQMFPPNALVAQAGAYGPPEQELGKEKAAVRVLYTEEPLVLPAAWRPRPCGSLRLLEVTVEGPYSLCYAGEQGYTLFFSFAAAEEGPALPEALRCRFVEAFVGRFRVLRGLVKEELGPPFPGVLEIGAP